MNNSGEKKSWAYWFRKGIKSLAQYIFVDFVDTLIWYVCKYTVLGGVLLVIALPFLLFHDWR